MVQVDISPRFRLKRDLAPDCFSHADYLACSFNTFLFQCSPPTDVARGIRLSGDVLGLLRPVRGESDGEEGVSRLPVGGALRTRAESDVSNNL